MLQTDRILSFSLFKMEHSAGFLCPAVLLHIFALEFGISCFKIRKKVTPDPFRIYSVIRGFVLKHTVSSDLLQRIFQIKYQLADIRQVLGVIRTAGKEYRAYLPCGHSCPASVNKHRQDQLGLCSFERYILRLVKTLFSTLFSFLPRTRFTMLSASGCPALLGKEQPFIFLLSNFVKAYATISASSSALLLFFLFI